MSSVLLIEDNSSDAALIRRALEKTRARPVVEVIGDGEAALALLQSPPTGSSFSLPDLILLDFKLPKLNGAEVLGALRSSDRTVHIPTVVLTSSRLAGDVRAAYSNGANSYLVKPSQFATFVDILARVTEYWLEYNQAPRLAW